MKARIRAQAAPWHSAVELFVTDSDRRSRVKSVVLESVEEGAAYPSSFTIDTDKAQVLMDDLWNCGLRPTEGSGSAGALRAVEHHLEDMRKIALKKLSIT